LKELDDEEKRVLRIARLWAAAFLIGAPIAYLAIGYLIMSRSTMEPRPLTIVVQVILGIGLIVPALWWLMRPLIFKLAPTLNLGPFVSFGNSTRQVGRFDNGYMAVSIVKFSLVNVLFVFSYIAFIISANIMAMLWMYPAGAVYAYLFWPRELEMRSFLEKVKTHVPAD